MPISKNAGFRYRIIDTCLRSKQVKYPNIEYLQEKISDALNLDSTISESSINKDLKSMRVHYKAPIKYHKEYKGYYYDDPNFSINSFPLTADEIRVLDLSVSFLKQIKFSGFFHQFESTIEKLISGFRLSKIEGFEKFNILQTEEPLADLGTTWIHSIYESIIYKQVIEIGYKRYHSDHINKHLFSPYLIKEYRNRWYTIGYSELSKTLLTLALDRIDSIKLTNNKYILDSDFNGDEYFNYAFGITTYLDTNPEIVQLHLDNFISSYAISKPLHHSQQVEVKENGIELTMKCFLTPELDMAILSYGEYATVIAPEKLKERIFKRIQKMNKIQ